jgi:hypothetical protein
METRVLRAADSVALEFQIDEKRAVFPHLLRAVPYASWFRRDFPLVA